MTNSFSGHALRTFLTTGMRLPQSTAITTLSPVASATVQPVAQPSVIQTREERPEPKPRAGPLSLSSVYSFVSRSGLSSPSIAARGWAKPEGRGCRRRPKFPVFGAPVCGRLTPCVVIVWMLTISPEASYIGQIRSEPSSLAP